MYKVRKNTAEDRPDGTTIIRGNCSFTGKPYQVVAKTSEVKKFMEGALAQDAFPTMNKEDREFLISSITPEGWKKFG